MGVGSGAVGRIGTNRLYSHRGIEQYIKNPFEVNIDNTIKEFIAKNKLPKNGVIEINDDIDLKFYRYCLSIQIDFIENDKRVTLMNKLIFLGVKQEYARLIAIEAGASQICVNRKNLENFGLNKNIRRKVLSTIGDFYVGE